MKKYLFKCTCGDEITVDAMDMDDAKVKFAQIMTEDTVKAHFAEKHPGEEMPAYADLMASAVLSEVMETPAPMA